jgi:excinuclease ABC subunit A
MERTIELIGVRQHNLKGWDLDLPVGKWITITGVSGSGKSSLAMNVLYAEGQRRYVETFSPYARQFLERMDRPQVDEIRGIPPALAIEGNQPVKTSRSTVGTMTEIVDFLKLLFARASRPFCMNCQEEIKKSTPEDIWQESQSWPRPGPWIISFPLRVSGRDPKAIIEGLLRQGFIRVLKCGEVIPTEQWQGDDGQGELMVVMDRLFPERANKQRFLDTVEAALRYGNGRVAFHFPDGTCMLRSNQWLCTKCGTRLKDPSPHIFSFNSPVGACPECKGFGRVIDLDPDLVIPDPSKSIREGAVKPFSVPAARAEFRDLLNFCKRRGIPTDVPWAELSDEQKELVLSGDGVFYGVRGFFRWLEGKTYKMHVRVFLSRFRGTFLCPRCGGSRLKSEALQWRIMGRNVSEILSLSVGDALSFFGELNSTQPDNPAVKLLLEEIVSRLEYLESVGLSYLTLDRPSRTLSGGETERVMLTRALGTRLSNTLFVLDEPSIGLHARDIHRLSAVIRRLVAQENTAVVVEHDPTLILMSDHVVDLGPGAGQKGGNLLYSGPPSLLPGARGSVTGQYLSGQRSISLPRKRRRPSRERRLVVRGAEEHNLKGIDVVIPLGLFVCITGVSGSGKSTLLIDVLYRGVMRALGLPCERPGAFESIEGAGQIRHVELIDQRALGRTPRANPATFSKAWGAIRSLFASLPEARSRGYTPGTFSFNMPGGRCEYCQGEGFLKVEMQFLSDVLVSCPRCQGRRFSREVQDVQYNGRSISDVLEMTVDEALEFFQEIYEIKQALHPLQRIGLGYLRLGQPLTTLSGGEIQRLKLSRLLEESNGHGLYLLDEPTTGLHMEDIRILVDVLNWLVDAGNSVVVVEHNLDLISCADHIIDLGPEGGSGGGEIVAEGPPEKVQENPRSVTGRFLREHIRRPPAIPAREPPVIPLAQKEIRREAPVIRVVGAREHNLRNISVEIPRNRIVAITGVSGSGKSTFAFDIIFAEGQRRYLESLPTYIRQYIRVLDKADVDMVIGVPPTVSIEQRSAKAGRRSTVATLTEVYHFLRLLYAKVGTQHCPRCDIPISQGRIEEIVQSILERLHGRRISVLAPKVRGRKGIYRDLLQRAKRQGIDRVRVDGRVFQITDIKELDRYKEHWIEWVLEEDLLVDPDNQERITSSIEAALREGSGTVIVHAGPKEDLTFSRQRTCPSCGRGFDELDPRHFSFNSPMGACPRCEGLGVIYYMEKARQCPSCNGTRLNEIGRSVRLFGRPVTSFTEMTISEAMEFWRENRFPESLRPISDPVIREVISRLEILEILGLDYLELNRSAETLSGGEAQRIRLAAQLGSNLSGVCYVLDEPTIGLHPRDHKRLMDALRRLRDRGNTVLVVEHDDSVIQASDWIIDMGPGPGRDGGLVVEQGPWSRLASSDVSITSRCITDPSRRRITSRFRKASDGKWLRIVGATQNNLKGIDVSIPLGTLTCVTGVSGSGKSSLVHDVLYEGLRSILSKKKKNPENFERIEGWEELDRVLEVDHSPIGRTPRSTPATYVKLWDEIRRFFALLPEARARGYTPGRFSFNVISGRCPICQGQGVIKQEMAFLPDVYTQCEACCGARFNSETLEVNYKGKHIGDILSMTVEEAYNLFDAHPQIRRPLQVLRDLGLGYISLGQPSPTLSGGEAQRVKLAVELSKNSRARTLYVLDEPTTGLHLQDVHRLLNVLHRFVDRGDTVVVIEHHLDVIAAADHVIDLGPGAGPQGGRVVAQGNPQQILAMKDVSHTAQCLWEFLNGGISPPPRPAAC